MVPSVSFSRSSQAAAEAESGVEADVERERRVSVAWNWTDADAGAPSWSWVLCCSSVAACTCIGDISKFKSWAAKYKSNRAARAALLKANGRAIANANCAGRSPLAVAVTTPESAPASPLSQQVPLLAADAAVEAEYTDSAAIQSAPATPPSQSSSPSSASSPQDSPARETSSSAQSPADPPFVRAEPLSAPLATPPQLTPLPSLDAIEMEDAGAEAAPGEPHVCFWSGDWDSVRDTMRCDAMRCRAAQ